ncbi:hypothetical protein BXT84_05305 [Sulfobacillus thermotolerans]|uniref:N-acetyltransferase domain-containing protein n=1 Tax=Sulfobacillus thermotolerans TaxID=338644 RepID=A0ABN5GYH8_9FIRM|nr:hypothetical protein BXT84_05305 [Sulfobacillus thermotolerans]
MEVDEVHSARQWQLFRELVEEYGNTRGFSLEFQNFSAELEKLADIYARPSGSALLAFHKEHACGCVALKRLEQGICEMKRLYVRPSCRGYGLGRQLVERIMELGQTLGYERMRLDTLESLTAALHLYRTLGFYEIPRYNDNPRPDVRYLECRL